MDNKEKVQGLSIVMNGITINGPMFDIHDNHSVVLMTSSAPAQGGVAEESPAPSVAQEEASFESVMKAAEACQCYFWAQSSWAVVYCVCRDHLGMDISMSDFERRVAEYPLNPKTKPCPKDTIRATFRDNDYLRYPIHRWSKPKAKILAEALIKALEE